MSIALSDVVRQTRLRHPAFNREVVSVVALAEILSDYQRELIKLSAERLYSLVVDRMSIAFSMGTTNPVSLLMTALDFGVVTGVPAFGSHTGVGMKLVAGAPTNDTTVPLTVRYENGLLLPNHYKVIGGTCTFSASGTSGSSDPSTGPIYLGSQWGSEFHIVAYDQRMNPPVFPSGYVLDGKLFLCGQTADWTNFAGIDVRYVPLPPNLTDVVQTFRLPDLAREALNARANLAAAEWATARKRDGVDLQGFRTEKMEQETKLMQAISGRQSQVVRTTQRNR